jgi:acyl carrier protein
VLTVNRQALAEHRVAVALETEPIEMTQRLVGCGRAMPDHQLVIVDPTSSAPCEPREVGEVFIQGPSVAQGYWNRPEETAEIFQAKIVGREGRFVRTGDLGFIRDGELYVTGRLKDVIIIRGRNHYPQDIEQSAEEAHPAVLMGAAFALECEGGERLVVVHQLDRQYRDANMDQIVQAIRRSIVEHHELDPYAIVLIRQTSLPITSSGKVQRALCRQQYETGKLKVVHAWTNPGMNSTAAKGEGGRGRGKGSLRLAPSPLRLPPSAFRSVEVDRTAERIEGWMLQWLVVRLSLNPADVSRDRPFAEYGVDSLTAVEMSRELEDQFQVPLPPIVAWNYPTPATLSRYLAEQTVGVASSETAAGPLADLPVPPDDDRLAELLAEIENLSDDEAARLLAEEE